MPHSSKETPTPVSTQRIEGSITLRRAASNASTPRPAIHQKISPTKGHVIALHLLTSIPFGTHSVFARLLITYGSWTSPAGMSSSVGVQRRRSVFRMERSISGLSKSNGKLKCESVEDFWSLGIVEMSNENRGGSLVKRVDRMGHRAIAQISSWAMGSIQR